MSNVIFSFRTDEVPDITIDEEIQIKEPQSDITIDRMQGEEVNQPNPEEKKELSTQDEGNESNISTASLSSVTSIASSIKYTAHGRTPFLCGQIISDIDEIVIGSYYEILNGENIEVLKVTSVDKEKQTAGGTFLKCIGKSHAVDKCALFVADKFWEYDFMDVKSRLSDVKVIKKGRREYFYFEEIGLEGEESEETS